MTKKLKSGTTPTAPRGRVPIDPAKLKDYNARKKAYALWVSNQTFADDAPAKTKKKPAKKSKPAPAQDKPAPAKAPPPLADPKPGRSRQGGTKGDTPPPDQTLPPAARRRGAALGKGKASLFGVEAHLKPLSMADLPAIIELFQTHRVEHLRCAGFELKLTSRTEHPGGGGTEEKPGRDSAGVDPGPRSHIARDPEAERDLESAQRLIDSPLDYEQAQIDAQLGQANGGSFDDQDEDYTRETQLGL